MEHYFHPGRREIQIPGFTLTTDWTGNEALSLSTGRDRIDYFLRKFRSFNVDCKILHIFNQSVVASASANFFAAICWGSSIKASDSKKLSKLIKKAGSLLWTFFVLGTTVCWGLLWIP